MKTGPIQMFVDASTIAVAGLVFFVHVSNSKAELPANRDPAIERERAACIANNEGSCEALVKSEWSDDQEVAHTHLVETKGAACDRGDSKACASALKHLVASFAMTNYATDATVRDRYLRYATKGCTDTVFDTCLTLAKGYEKSNTQKAIEIYTRACNGSVGDACSSLASAFKDGRHVPVDADRARTLFTQACALKDVEACVEIGDLQKACDLGNAESCVGTGQVEKACAHGDEASCVALCKKGNRHSCELAVPLLTDADQLAPLCKSGVRGACHAACEQGALEQCTPLCKHGDEAACQQILATGDDTAKQAVCETGHTDVCKKACEEGNTIACDALCKREEKGTCEHASADMRDRIETRVARREAEDNIPKLMAACERHRAAYATSSANLTASHRSGDHAAEGRAEDALEKVKNAWSEVRSQLGSAVMTVTGGGGARYEAFRREARQRCSSDQAR